MLSAALGAVSVPLATAAAQNPRAGAPRTPFGAPDLAKVKWLEGSWAGTAEGESTI